MSRFARVSARVGLTAIAGASLAIAVALPANSHTGLLFTATSGDGGGGYFASLNPADAAMTTLATPYSAPYYAAGVEIAAENGYVILNTEGDPGTFNLGTWDHTSGAVGSVIGITDATGVITDLYALDTTPDGTLLALADRTVIDGEFPVDERWVVSIDPATGAITPLVDLTGVEENFLDSIATDPTTGITYVFTDEDDGQPKYLTVDIATGTYSATVELLGVRDDLGDGYVLGADFDTAGTLWFNYIVFDDDDVLASLAGPVSGDVAAVASGTIDNAVSDVNLTYDPYVAPQLAATGLPVLAIAAGAAVLVGAGAAGVAITRRRSA